MGNAPSSASETGEKSAEGQATLVGKLGISRPAAITEGKRTKGGSRPPGAVKASPNDLQYIQASCTKLSLRSCCCCRSYSALPTRLLLPTSSTLPYIPHNTHACIRMFVRDSAS